MFKKNKQLIIGFLLGALLFGIVPVGATVQEYLLKKSKAKITVDGKEFANKELPVLLYKGYNYIPAATFREVCDTIGVGFEWAGEKKEIRIDTKKIMPTQERKVDSVEKIVKDGFNLISDNGVEYVSLKEIIDKHGEKGYSFGWNEKTRETSLTHNSHAGRPMDKNEVLILSIPTKVFSGATYTKYLYFKEDILPLIK